MTSSSTGMNHHGTRCQSTVHTSIPTTITAATSPMRSICSLNACTAWAM